MSDEPDVIERGFGDGILRRLASWATAYAGGCGHGPQITRPGESQSRCWDCIQSSPGSWTTSVCDLCGAYVDDFDRIWAADPQVTGGVVVAFGICTTCSDRELHDLTITEENHDMTTTTTACRACRASFTAQAAMALGSRPDFTGLHSQCRNALADALRVRRSADESLGLRVRMIVAARALRNAA